MFAPVLVVGRALMAAPRLLLPREPRMGLAPELVAGIVRRFPADRSERMCAPGIADRLDVMEAVRAPRAGSANRLLRAPQVQRACLGA